MFTKNKKYTHEGKRSMFTKVLFDESDGSDLATCPYVLPCPTRRIFHKFADAKEMVTSAKFEHSFLFFQLLSYCYF